MKNYGLHCDLRPDCSIFDAMRLHSFILLSGCLFLLLLPSALEAQNQPLKNFDAFCDLFDQNYASFEEKGIDWTKACETAREKLTENSIDAELYSVLKSLLVPLNDAHVTLRAKSIDSAMSASRPSRIIEEISSIPGKERRPKFRAMTEATLLANGFAPIKEIGPEYKDEILFSYTKNDRIGYLRYTRSFSTLANMTGSSLNKRLDEIFGSYAGLESVIIDIRFNIGGDDAFSQRIAGYLVDEPTIGFYKQTRKKQVFGELKTKMIEPSKKHYFNGKVVLLTNDKSVSAADVMALMLSELPQATLIGEPSNGSYSDLQNGRLPNGWKVTLSNQRYLSAQSKKNYEGFGTPVDIEAKNMLSDIEKQEDSVLIRALSFLKK